MNTTPTEAQNWKRWMPKPGNGGVPSQKQADDFASAAAENRELRRKVLSELAELKEVSVGTALSVVAAVVAALNAILAAAPESVAPPEFRLSAGFISLLLIAGVALAGLRATQQARHASSWLDAYREAGASELPPRSATGLLAEEEPPLAAEVA
ncbi:hypothetical protein ACQXVK_02715 [Curtobacterium sp. AB451]|uniref:hypothetical protein n=1 Tax=Curtobacterium sp. AB451 TaxID=3422306 RepID=UPI003D331377